jgi:hypothetical protein
MLTMIALSLAGRSPSKVLDMGSLHVRVECFAVDEFFGKRERRGILNLLVQFSAEAARLLARRLN